MGIIGDFVIRSAKGNGSILIADDIIRPLIPKPDKIGRRNITETARYSGADAFKSRGWSPVGKVFRHHRHHKAQMSARRAARNRNPVRVNIEAPGVFSDKPDGIAAIAEVFRKTAGPAQTILDGKDRQSTVHENLPAAHTLRRPGCLATKPPPAVNFHDCRDRRGGRKRAKTRSVQADPHQPCCRRDLFPNGIPDNSGFRRRHRQVKAKDIRRQEMRREIVS